MKKKVLVILNRLVIGGQTLDTLPLLYHLKDDFEMEVLYGLAESDEREALFLLKQSNGIRFTPMRHFSRSIGIFRDVKAYFFIFNSIRKFKPDVVHTHGLKAGMMGRTAAYLNGVKCIIHTFHGHHFHSYFNAAVSKGVVLAERLVGRITTKIIAISNGQKREFVEVYKIAPAQKIQVIPLGIDEQLFASSPAPPPGVGFRRQYALEEEATAIGIIGRIVPVKNYALFVKVVANIMAQHTGTSHIKFFVIGDGDEKKAMQAAFDARGINWCAAENFNAAAPVVFTSWLEDVSGAVHGLDVVVLTSHNEGTPMSLIEAQFCGKPVVATNVGGVKDTVQDGETGFLVPANDAEAFTEKLLILINDTALRHQMGAKAALFAAKSFSKAAEIASFKNLYQYCQQ